jgi:hypothetical protein
MVTVLWRLFLTGIMVRAFLRSTRIHFKLLIEAYKRLVRRTNEKEKLKKQMYLRNHRTVTIMEYLLAHRTHLKCSVT